MNFEDYKNFAAALQSFAATIAYIIGGIWVWRQYFYRMEGLAHIESEAEISIIGKQNGYWIVELIGILENKGKTQLSIAEFNFNLQALDKDAVIEENPNWNGQVNFSSVLIEKGYLKPVKYKYYFVGPGIKAKYSYIARVPETCTILNFHCWFTYTDRKMAGHTAEATIRLSSAGNT